MRILIIETDPQALKRALEKKDFHVDAASNRADADRMVRSIDFAAIVLERELGSEDGLALLKNWRLAGVTTHVLLLTTRMDLQDKIHAFSLGVDDCLQKPYERDELIARLRTLACLQQANEQVLRVFDLEIDLSARVVKRAGKGIDLTPREFDLLHFLAVNRGKPVSRSMIWEHLYDDSAESRSNVIDVYIRYLRKKIDAGADVPLILTCWGKGYMLRGHVEEGEAPG